MKKTLCLLLVIALLTAALCGCGKKAPAAFAAKNEISTYERIDPQKTQLVVSRTGNVPLFNFCDAFEARNPDVQLVYLDITGGNDSYMPLVDWITKGYAPDIVFSGATFFNETLTPQYFVNLSADPIIQNYEAAALQRTAVDNEIYSLPGPSNINAIMYNKTLFQQYGWEVPATFDAFIALCDQIRADSNGEIEPWNPNAKYDQELLTSMEGFTYAALFGGAENRSWYNDFLAGEATFAGHMEPYMEVLQTLVDHNLLREEHFSYSATTRGKEFAAGKIAMINMNIYDADNEQFDFGYMPFPTTKGALGYLSDSYSCFLGIPLKTHTEQEQDAIDRFLAFFSSPEGQQIYIGNSMMVSNVKGVPLAQSDDLAALQPVIQAGHMFAIMNFGRSAGGRANVNLQQSAIDIAAGTMTPAECIAAVDAAASAPETVEAAEPPEVLATVEKDMTVLETSFYLADMYRERTGADIGLIAHDVAYRGNLMRFFAGEVTAPMVTVFKPRSFSNDSSLVKVSMTGQQILDALNHPVGNEGVADCVYAYAGLRCEIAPWSPTGEKYLSVKRADGSALDPETLYTVGIWAGTVGDEYITETLARYEGAWETHMTEKLRASGAVTPANDGRVKLVWNE